jgi:hypothetical protein
MTDHRQPSLFPAPAPAAPDHAESLKWVRDRIIEDESPERQQEDSKVEYDPDRFHEGGKG